MIYRENQVRLFPVGNIYSTSFISDLDKYMCISGDTKAMCTVQGLQVTPKMQEWARSHRSLWFLLRSFSTGKERF